MGNFRSKSTKDAIVILQGAVKHLTDRLDRLGKDTKELRDDIEKHKKARIG